MPIQTDTDFMEASARANQQIDAIPGLRAIADGHEARVRAIMAERAAASRLVVQTNPGLAEAMTEAEKKVARGPFLSWLLGDGRKNVGQLSL